MKISKSMQFSLFSGLMIGTSYIPFPPWALFFCLTPLWSQYLKETSYKKIFLMGWITQFVLAIVGFHWIPHTITEFGHLPRFVGFLGLMAFAAFTNLHIPLAGVAWLYLKKKNLVVGRLQNLICIAVLTALFEKLNPQIFPWHMGYPWLYGSMPGYQIADVIGFTGLSTLTYLINAWVLLAVLSLKENRAQFRKYAGSLILVFCAINLLGLYQKYKWNHFDSSLKVMAVQPNIGNQEKQFDIYGPRFKTQVIQKHFKLTEQELQNSKPDLIIWPETSIPEYLDPYFYSQINVENVLNFIRKHQTPVLTGAYTHNLKTFQDSNSIFLFNGNAEPIGLYKKHLLLAFGEYLPLSDYFPSLLLMLPTVANFERGIGPTILELGDVKIGPQICYEGLHPWFTDNLSNQGADILVNITNDSWFGHTFESSQHLFMTLARSIEVRRPMVRVTNTGISTAILANGQILEFSPQKQEWAHTFDIQYLKNAPETLFAIFPYIDILSCLALLLFATGVLKNALRIRNDKLK